MPLKVTFDTFRLLPDSSFDRDERLELADAWDLSTVLIDSLDFDRLGRAIDSDDPELRSTDAHLPFRVGFRLDATDEASADWYPQGITGAFDAASVPASVTAERRLVLISGYTRASDCETPKGCRLTVADLSEYPTVRYCHVLLVEPVRDTEGMASYRAIEKDLSTDNLEDAPHAGGCTWLGDYLYVTDENRLLVFDLRRLKDLGGPASDSTCTDQEVGLQGGRYRAFGFRYILPLMGYYEVDPDEPRLLRHFHTIGLRRHAEGLSIISTKFLVPPLVDALLEIVGVSYDSDPITGLLCAWDVDPETGLLAQRFGVVESSFALTCEEEPYINGVCAPGEGLVYLAHSAFADVVHAIRVHAVHGFLTQSFFNWPGGGEGLAYDEVRQELWNLTEHPGERVYFAVESDPDLRTWPYAPDRFLIDPRNLNQVAPYLYQTGWRIDPYEYVEVLDNPPFPKDWWPDVQDFLLARDLLVQEPTYSSHLTSRYIENALRMLLR